MQQENTNNKVQVMASQSLIDNAKLDSYNFMNPERWSMMTNMANTFVASGALPTTIKNAAQLVMIMQAGYEAGLQPMAALRSFYFVNGRLSMFGEVAIAKVREAGHKILWENCNENTATVTITRGDTGESMTETFTMDMARKRGLTNKGGAWVSAPDNMLKFKAFWAAARFLVPDAFSRDGVAIQIGEIVEAEIIEDAPKETEELKKSSLKQALESRPDVAERTEEPVKKTKRLVKEKEPIEPATVEPAVEVSNTESEMTDAEKFEKNSARYRELRNKFDNDQALTEEEHKFFTAYVNGEI